MRRSRAVPLCLAAALFAFPAGAGAIAPPGAPGCSVFPSDNVWHSDISKLPVHARSAAWLASMDGASTDLHPDFGSSGEPMPYGIPYTVVAASHPDVPVDFYYPDESDPGPYPFGEDTPIEGGSDRHAIMIDKSTCTLYELFDAEYASGGNSTAGSGAIWNLKSNALRPAGWTSADAAGLPIFAGLVRIDEVKAGKVDHAIRMTAQQTDTSYVWPARHQAGAANNKNLPPMGARFRLKASYSTNGFRSDTKAILAAMKKYGMILADNGSDWYFTGAASDDWSNDMLDELKTVPASAFEAVDASSLMISPNSGKAKQASGPPPAPAPSSSSPKSKPKPTVTPSPTPTPEVVEATSSPTATTTPSASPSVAVAADIREETGSLGWWPWALVALLTAAAVVVKRYLLGREG
ncbi:MAG TPA: hypothetical protein VJ922_03785 [Actinomycetota bacterium]|nr:hypothetical protein [Actinomycetota bacterium]